MPMLDAYIPEGALSPEKCACPPRNGWPPGSAKGPPP